MSVEEPSTPEALHPRITVTGIKASSAVVSGASSVLGIFSPVPLRIPAGLGALSIDAELVDSDGRQVAAMHWARGANSVTNSARLSSIGDAWQLAAKFGKEFARAVLDTDNKRAGLQRARLPAADVASNRQLCAERFGRVSLSGRGASLVLPMSPESIDPGPPADTMQR